MFIENTEQEATMKVTTVRLQQDVEKHLDRLAFSMGRGKGWIINEAVREYAARQALSKQRKQETLEAMESAVADNVVNGCKVHDYLRSWGAENELPPPLKEDQEDDVKQ